jgi:hypothetical protein
MNRNRLRTSETRDGRKLRRGAWTGLPLASCVSNCVTAQSLARH